MTGRRPVVAVVGGGIAGLAAAWELSGAGVEVHVLERDDRFGGKLRSAQFGGRRVDLAADAFLARRPEATDLCRELGLDEALVAVGASGASVWARGRLRPLPAGLRLGVPTRWWPLARSGILSPLESLRAARDLAPGARHQLCHARVPTRKGDRTVGDIVGGRLGRPVVERLADPLIGGIHAGRADALSAAATFPPLLAAGLLPGSLMVNLRLPPGAAAADGAPPGTPLFWSLRHTVAGLVDELAVALERRGVGLHAGRAVESLRRGPGGTPRRPTWSLQTAPVGTPTTDGATAGGPAAVPPTAVPPTAVDGVVLALPAPGAGALLAPLAPRASGLLSGIPYSSVAVVTLAVAPGAIGVRRTGTGFLVPRTSPVGGRAALVTGVTYLDRKWPHLGRPDHDLVRASVGRSGDDRHAGLDDDELVGAVVEDLGVLVGLRGGRGALADSLVTRWDGAFPQYQLDHLLAVGRVEDEVADLGGVAVAGAALRGVGIPACVGSGRLAARQVLAQVAGTGSDGPPRPADSGPDPAA